MLMISNVVFRSASMLSFVLVLISTGSVANGNRLRKHDRMWPFSDESSKKPSEEPATFSASKTEEVTATTITQVKPIAGTFSASKKEAVTAKMESSEHSGASSDPESTSKVEKELEKVTETTEKIGEHLENMAPTAPREEAKAPFTNYRQVLHNFQNVQYFADFKIGGQDIAGIFDTGSFELLVRSSKCDACVHPTPPYDNKKSNTFKSNGTTTQHVFGSGPCVSEMGFDDVAVGPLVSKQQAFWEIIRHQIAVLDQAKFAAIVGIGPNFAFQNTEKTLLMSFGITEFSICLQKEAGADGYLTWGPTLVPISFQSATAKVVGKHHWATPLTDVTFQEPTGHLGQIPCGGDKGCIAIVDSGTSLIAAPGLALMQLSQQIPPIADDCSNLHELPTLRFNIDGNPFELPPQAYVMRVTGATLEANDIWDILFFKPKIRRINMCMPAFMQIDMMSQFGPVWILGMPFFRYYHTTFDRISQTMRFATAGPACEPLPYVRRNNTAVEKANKTDAEKSESLLGFHKGEARMPMDVDVGAMVPPTLSGMIDFPFGNAGMLEI